MNPTAAQTGHSLQSGIRVGNYLLQEKIGQGGFAEVWRAVHHERPNGPLAVKIAVSDEFRRHLVREGRVPDVKHPNIVPILDSDTRFAELPYIVTPFYSGGSLAEVIAKHPDGLAERQVEVWLSEILSGLAAAHERGIVHRDVKPSNVLIDGSGRALIGDFGLCNAGANDVDALRSVMHSASFSAEHDRIAGTMAYMAPEVRDGNTANGGTDVYSVGVLLFEMLTGHRPMPLELPSQRRPTLMRAADWDGLYYWACRAAPERFADAAAMLVALRDGSAPAPLALSAAPATAPRIALPAPAALPTDIWEALLQRWREWRLVRDAVGYHRDEIKNSSRIYSRTHPAMQALLAQEAQLWSAEDERKEAVRAVGRQIVDRLTCELAPLDERRRSLLGQGCLPTHPDVLALTRQMGPSEAVRFQVRELVEDFESSELASCMSTWMTACELHRRRFYRAFLKIFGSGPENPWAAAAKRRLAAGRMKLLLAVGALLVAAILVVTAVV